MPCRCAASAVNVAVALSPPLPRPLAMPQAVDGALSRFPSVKWPLIHSRRFQQPFLRQMPEAPAPGSSGGHTSSKIITRVATTPTCDPSYMHWESRKPFNSRARSTELPRLPAAARTLSCSDIRRNYARNNVESARWYCRTAKAAYLVLVHYSSVPLVRVIIVPRPWNGHGFTLDLPYMTSCPRV